MGRPLSRRITDHLLPWQRGPWPADWNAVFGRRAPLALEVGFGNGAFLVEEAAAHPERDHVGVELSWTSATHLFRRLDARGLSNVRAVLGDARVALATLFAPGSLDAVFVNHPCPWPKARHEGRRLVDARFLAQVAHALRPGGELLIVTDHAEYAAWVREALAAEPALASRHPTAELARLPGRTATKYERKALDQGLAIHYFEWEKRAEPAALPPTPRPIPTGPTGPTDADMLSLTLRGPIDLASTLAAFCPRLHREEHEGVEVVVRLVGAYRRVGRDAEHPAWLVEALVKEDELRQEVAIAVLAGEEQRTTVKLSPLVHPLPTHGVKRAVWLVGELLREAAPELELAHENLGREVTGAR